jgi:aerobic carbon-monoxide dehydrogenase small subunit
VSEHRLELRVNGETRRVVVEDRTTLADALRDQCQLTGTHLACEHGVCGACTVLVDGRGIRSCLVFAVQAVGSEVTTIEGLTPSDGSLSPLQEAFREEHGLQCGFCTPGFVVSLTEFLAENPSPSDDELREAVSGNLCRCTGYQGILRAARRAADRLAADRPASDANGDGGGAGATAAAPAKERA